MQGRGPVRGRQACSVLSLQLFCTSEISQKQKFIEKEKQRHNRSFTFFIPLHITILWDQKTSVAKICNPVSEGNVLPQHRGVVRIHVKKGAILTAGRGVREHQLL